MLFRFSHVNKLGVGIFLPNVFLIKKKSRGKKKVDHPSLRFLLLAYDNWICYIKSSNVAFKLLIFLF